MFVDACKKWLWVTFGKLECTFENIAYIAILKCSYSRTIQIEKKKPRDVALPSEISSNGHFRKMSFFFLIIVMQEQTKKNKTNVCMFSVFFKLVDTLLNTFINYIHRHTKSQQKYAYKFFFFKWIFNCNFE